MEKVYVVSPPYLNDMQSQLSIVVGEYLKPFIASMIFGVDPQFLDMSSVTVARNVNLNHEYPGLEGEPRKLSLSTHMHFGDPFSLIVLIYLSKVDDESACFRAMRKQGTDDWLRLRPHSSLQAMTSLQTRVATYFPRAWAAEALALNYTEECVAGPPGTVVVFRPDIAHRASRPVGERKRDSVQLRLGIVRSSIS
eukprot:TRINITY_DN97178_c0_g1_i1.p1 TRINITY_DN97178_c0_g1~~TRINITY_DN97178_c0_g1_i1.p1  ORF type:complete len:212 (+),score=13.77 TRINITY_DN97178_c0_g1_i1:53-637(+)